jgi:hypothetical protein
MSKFIVQMTAHMLAAKAQRLIPGISLDPSDACIHAHLLTTAPFANCPPGHNGDVRRRCNSLDLTPVLCPHKEPLLQTLATSLADYGMMYAEMVEAPRIRKHNDLRRVTAAGDRRVDHAG